MVQISTVACKVYQNVNVKFLMQPTQDGSFGYDVWEYDCSTNIWVGKAVSNNSLGSVLPNYGVVRDLFNYYLIEDLNGSAEKIWLYDQKLSKWDPITRATHQLEFESASNEWKSRNEQPPIFMRSSEIED